jgi:uncharacterized protein (DUF1015 family)
MAEVRPLQALHYNLAVIGSLQAVVAPPYDVIDEAQRERLLARSPFNVVELDLPRAPGGADRYEHAAETLESWTLEGVLTRDREPAIWALEQDYEAPAGGRTVRRGFLAGVRLEEYGNGIRPHERTQPGPREDRLRLTRATRHNLSPVFSLHPGDAWRQIEPALQGAPWGHARDEDGTVSRVWRIADPAVHEAIAAGMADAELLIADGHHRYETALAYEREIGGEGRHSYVLMCLVSLEDPGLTVFPTHRLLTGLADDPSRQEALGAGLKDMFEIEAIAAGGLDPAGRDGVGVFGYIDSHFKDGLLLRLRDPSAAEEALAGRSPAYRRLDAAILEALVLKGLLGMTDEDIAAKRGIAYTASASEALNAVQSGAQDAAFLLRAAPVEQVRAVAAAGETMPPKSTYFFPKLPTGIVFNPLS